MGERSKKLASVRQTTFLVINDSDDKASELGSEDTFNQRMHGKKRPKKVRLWSVAGANDMKGVWEGSSAYCVRASSHWGLPPQTLLRPLPSVLVHSPPLAALVPPSKIPVLPRKTKTTRRFDQGFPLMYDTSVRSDISTSHTFADRSTRNT